MRIRATWTWMCFAAGVFESGCNVDDLDELPQAASAALQRCALGPNQCPVPKLNECTKHVFLPDSGTASSTVCPPDVCGVNSMWLGQGVAFRTIHLDGSQNEQNMKLVKFERWKGGPKLRFDVDRDSVIGELIDVPPGTATTILQGTDLVGSVLSFRRTEPSGTITDYAFTIVGVTYHPSAAGCKAGTPCDERQIPVYTFTAETGQGCKVEICDPTLSPNDAANPNLEGQAVIFQGDIYNPNTLEITPAPVFNNPYGIVNIACFGTAISKLHFLRHTSASQDSTPAALQPSNLERQTLLRLLTGDYCGTGEFFTVNGLKIELGFNSAVYAPTADSEFEIGLSDLPDAGWNHHGATCIGTPRLASVNTTRTPAQIIGDINAACYTAGKPPLPSCSPADLSAAAYRSATPPTP